MLKVAADLGRTPAQVAIRWVVEQPGISAAIVGARSAAHLRDNLEASTLRLQGESLERLNEISRLPDRYPEAMQKNIHERRNSAIDMPSL